MRGIPFSMENERRHDRHVNEAFALDSSSVPPQLGQRNDDVSSSFNSCRCSLCLCASVVFNSPSKHRDTETRRTLLNVSRKVLRTNERIAPRRRSRDQILFLPVA